MQSINTNEQIFFYDGKNVRTVWKDGELWWVLKDVCDVLELSNPTIVAARLEEDEKAKIDPKLNLGSRSNEPITIINESGLYKVILRSDKPEAKKFTRWVTREVLPQIRKRGAYITGSKMEELMNDPDAWIDMIRAIKKEREEKEGLQTRCRDLRLQIEHIRQEGFLIKRNGTDYNMPTQKAMELGLFKIKETAITHSDGHISVSKTVKVTGKGQRYFVNYFLNVGGDDAAN